MRRTLGEGGRTEGAGEVVVGSIASTGSGHVWSTCAGIGANHGGCQEWVTEEREEEKQTEEKEEEEGKRPGGCDCLGRSPQLRQRPSLDWLGLAWAGGEDVTTHFFGMKAS